MTPDVVAVGILENAPGFKPPIYRLVSRSNTRLHPLVGNGVARVVWALDLVGGAHGAKSLYIGVEFSNITNTINNM